MFGLGAGEILIILVFALIFIGPKKLPDLAKSLGKGLREFQKAKNELFDPLNSPPEEPPTPQNELSQTNSSPEAIEVSSQRPHEEEDQEVISLHSHQASDKKGESSDHDS